MRSNLSPGVLGESSPRIFCYTSPVLLLPLVFLVRVLVLVIDFGLCLLPITVVLHWIPGFSRSFFVLLSIPFSSSVFCFFLSLLLLHAFFLILIHGVAFLLPRTFILPGVHLHVTVFPRQRWRASILAGLLLVMGTPPFLTVVRIRGKLSLS